MLLVSSGLPSSSSPVSVSHPTSSCYRSCSLATDGFVSLMVDTDMNILFVYYALTLTK